MKKTTNWSLVKVALRKWVKNNLHKLLMALLVMMLGTILCIYFSAYLNTFLITHHPVGLFSQKLSNCIKSILANARHRMLFFCLDGFVLMFSAYLIFAENKPYQSDTRRITPDITIPVSAGQGQFGTADFLKEKEYDLAFGSFYLDSKKPVIKYLIETGYDDLEADEENDDGKESHDRRTEREGGSVYTKGNDTEQGTAGLDQSEPIGSDGAGERFAQGIISHINSEIRRIEDKSGGGNYTAP